MKIIADLHIHSKYARACSKDLNPQNLGLWAQKKGVQVLGTGDFTHFRWLAELQDALVETKPGLYRLKDADNPTLFMLTAEVASIYKKGDKVRRVHNLLFAPNFEAVTKLNLALEKRGVNLKSDGRPIMGVPCDELVKICKSVDEKIEIIPAHAWTPHFGVFGSLSGFDSLEEAFGDQAKYIFAIETGLSSDPKMNWQISGLDKISLISNSDAHSLRKLGREANVFEISEAKLSFSEIMRVIKNKNPKEFLSTIEFFPEEGKYHLDGHADCKFSCEPKITEELSGLCPTCGKKLLRGVMNRVAVLADRKVGMVPPKVPAFKNTIPLEEIIAETLGVGVQSKKVTSVYESAVSKIPELTLLFESSELQLSEVLSKPIAKSVMKVRNGQVQIAAGYDGVFGKISIR
jgi:uncharacterized protein (TIGR00375 family)